MFRLFQFLTAAVVTSVLSCLVVTTPASAQPVQGPTGNYYQVVVAPGISWPVANAAATQVTFGGVRGHLATISSADEDRFVEGLRRTVAGSTEFWIGGFQRVNQATPGGGWEWVNGEGPIVGQNNETLYANWLGSTNGAPPEPNDCCTTAGIEDNEENYLGTGLYGLTGWNDEKFLEHINGYVVEYEINPVPPQPPTSLTVASTPSQTIQLTWSHPQASEMAFVLERRNSSFCPWQPLAQLPANTTTYLDASLPWSDQIQYRVAAKNAAGISDWVESNIVSHPAVPRWQIKLYRGGIDQWVDLRPCDNRFRSDFGTAVIVHGWDPPVIGGDPLNGWMLDMAQLIHGKVKPGVNVLAWEWQEEARGLVINPRAAGNIDQQAGYLAQALGLVFSQSDYQGPVHLIGHSMGSRVILISAQHLGRHDPLVPTVFPPAQVTLLDTPDRAITRGNIVQNIATVRDMGVYVDSYYGCTNDGPYNAHVWVDVPCVGFRECPFFAVDVLICHAETHEWYRRTFLTDPILNAESSCFAGGLSGTIGFGLSVLNDPWVPLRFDRCGLEVGTLKFSKLSLCSNPLIGLETFGLDNSRECQAVSPPTTVSKPTLSFGEFSDNCRFCELQTPESFFLSTGVHLPGEGGGGQVDEIVVSFSLPLTISDEWDYLQFEYDFTEVVAEATLEATLTVGDTVYPLFLMPAGPILSEAFLDTGLRDIRDLHGQEVTLTFELRSGEPGAVVYIRNLTLWRDPYNSNHRPTADAGTNQEAVVDSVGFASVELDGSGSSDEDGDRLTHQWLVEGQLLAVGESPTVKLLPGIYSILLVVRDPADAVGTNEVAIVVNQRFIRGDSNADQTVDLSDAINTLGVLFTGVGRISCPDAADANDSGDLDISDPVYTLGYLFTGANPQPSDPFPTPGPDLTPDNLYCPEY